MLLLLLILAAAAAGVLVAQVGPPPLPDRWPTWAELRTVLLLQPGRVPPAPLAADLPHLALWGAWLLVTALLAVRLLLIAALDDVMALTVGGVVRAALRRAVGALVLAFLVGPPDWPVQPPTPQQFLEAARGGPVPVDQLVAVGVLVAWLAWLWWTATVMVRALAVGWAAVPYRQPADEDESDWVGLAWLLLELAAAAWLLFQLTGAPHVPRLPRELPNWGALLVLLRSPLPPVDGLLEVAGALAWLAWAYLAGVVGLRLLAVAALLATRGAAWARGLGTLSDRLSPRFVQRTVSLAFVLQLVVRPPTAAAAPLSSGPIAAEMRSVAPPPPAGLDFTVGFAHAAVTAQADEVDQADEADDPDVVRHVVRKGETWWSITEDYLGHGDDYPVLKAANRGRRMPNGSVYDGISNIIPEQWEVVVRQPSRRVEVVDGERFYTTGPGDSLEGISARLLGEPARWTEVLALNRGVRTPDGRVLEHPGELPAGLRLHLPARNAETPMPGADQTAAQDSHDLLYFVQPGDTVSAIVRRFYDVGDGAPTKQAVDHIVAANLGRHQPGGGAFIDPDHIEAGWTLIVPTPTRGMEFDADGMWYIVQDGDSLSWISAAILGHEHLWHDVFERNRGWARTPDGRVLKGPDLIWKGLRLLLVPATPVPPPAVPSATSPSEATPTQPEAVPPPPVEPTRPTVPAPSPATPPPVSTPAPAPSAWTVSTPEPPMPEAPVRVAPGEPSPLDWDILPVAAAGAGLGLSAAVLAGLRASRQRPRRPPPELLAWVDETGTPVRPATLLVDTDSDPHDIRFAERLAGALVRRAARAGLTGVRVISAIVGSPAPVVVLAAPLADRDPLEALLRAATDLAHRIEVSSTTETDLVVRLEGVRPEALERVAARARPLLLCAGLLPDRRPWLVGWEALGHLLVASEPGTAQARAHLAALVASLAARRPPDGLRLYTLAAPDDPLGHLAPLPHQAAVSGPADADTTARVLAGLRDEVECRLAAVREGARDAARRPELVLAIAELGSVADSDDLAYLLRYGPNAGLRVLAATTDAATGRGPLVASFAARFVFGLDDEELSMALLGAPWALALNGPWRLLARLNRRSEVEISAARLEDAALQELLAALGTTGSAPTPDAIPIVPTNAAPPAEPGHTTAASADADETQASSPEPPPNPALEPFPQVSEAADASPSVSPPDAGIETNGHRNGTTEMAEQAARIEPEPVSDQPLPPAVALLAGRARVVVTCADASIWHAGRRLTLPEGRAKELLLRLAAAPALADPAANQRDRIVGELRHGREGPRRDDDSAAVAWLHVTGKRLGVLLARALPEPETDWDEVLVVDRQTGLVSLRDGLVLSDVQAFVSAASRAIDPNLGPAERRAAAEETLALGLPVLGDDSPRVLPEDLPEQVQERVGSMVPAYGWARQDAWERDAPAHLLALWRDAVLSLARAYRDSGQHAAAVKVYGTLLDQDPQLVNAQQGLLLAAAGTGDPARLEAAWQRVRIAWDGDVPDDLRDLHEQLRREVAARGTSR